MHREFILDGVKNGFNIIDPECVPISVEMDNYSSEL